MEHSFNIEIAKEYGVNAAIIYKNIRFWCDKNKANKKQIHDDNYWTYNSVRAWHELLPYLSEKQIKHAIKLLIDAELIIVGEYNKTKYDRTKWYAIREYSISTKGQMEEPKVSNEEVQKDQPIPDVNTNVNTYIKESVASAPSLPLSRQKKKVMYSDDDMGLAVTMYHNFLATNDGFKKPDLEMWANEFRLMREIDNRTVEKMDNFLNSLALDDDNMWQFWRGNILSPKSMRKNYDKVVNQYKKDIVDKDKVVNQNIPLSERVSALTRRVS